MLESEKKKKKQTTEIDVFLKMKRKKAVVKTEQISVSHVSKQAC